MPVIDLHPQRNATVMLIGEEKWKDLNDEGHTLAGLFQDALADPSEWRLDLDRTLRYSQRKLAALDPYAVFEQGEAAHRTRLKELDVEALKDIVAEHGMEPAKLVRKWKTPERIADHIVARVQARSRKGDAFRS